MLKYFADNNLVYYPKEQPTDWREAIKISCMPLKKEGIITDEYVAEVIESVDKFGPYIVIADQIAMPHAKADSPGVLGTGIGFTKFPNEVMFHDGETGEDKPATLFFVLAAKDDDQHLENISNLMELLMDEETVNKLLETESIEDFNKLL